MSIISAPHPLERPGFLLVLTGLFWLSVTAAGPFPAADSTLHLLSAIGFCLAAAFRLQDPGAGRPFPPVSEKAMPPLNWIRVSGAGFWIALILVLLLQAVSLPESLLSLLSPQSLADRVQTGGILAAARPKTGAVPHMVAAYDPDGAWILALRLASAGLLFGVLLVLLRSDKEIHLLAATVVAGGVVAAVQAAVTPEVNVSPDVRTLLEVALALCAGLYQARWGRRAVWPAAGLILAVGLTAAGGAMDLARCAVILAAAVACLREKDYDVVRILIPWGLAAAVVFRCVLFWHAHPEARDLIAAHLWWGVGPGAAGEWLGRAGGALPPVAARAAVWVMETGILGAAVAGSAVFLFVRQLTAVWLSRRDPRASGMGLGFTAAATMLVLGDTSLNLPAGPLVPAVAAAVAAAGYATVHRKGLGLMQTFRYPVQPIPGGRIVRWAIAGISVAWLAVMVVTAVGMPTAGPFDGAGGTGGQQALEDRLLRAPGSGRSWLDLAGIYEHMEDDPLQMIQIWLPLADRCYDRAVVWRPRDAEVLFAAASYWARRAAMLPEVKEAEAVSGDGPGIPATRQEGVRRFQVLFQEALRIDPNRWPEAVDAVRLYYDEDSIVIGIVPPENQVMQSEALRKF